MLVVALLLTALVSTQFLRLAESKDRDRFQYNAIYTQNAIASRLETHLAMLRSTAGLFAASEFVHPGEFRTFVDRLRLQKSYPGVQGVGFSIRLRPGEENRMLEYIRENVYPEFETWPADPSTDDLHAIVYLEPFDRRNRAAIGYNMHSDPIRREAMDRARDTGRAAASGKVTLVQEIDPFKQAGFLIYVPLYEGGDTPPTVEERREKLVGFAYSPFRADDLFGSVFGPGERRRVDFLVYDGETVDPSNLMHSSVGDEEFPAAADKEPRFSTVSSIRVAGKTWTIAYQSNPAFEYFSGRETVLYALPIAGALISLLLYALFSTRARARWAAIQSARDLMLSEEEARHQMQLTQTITQNAASALFLTDAEGRPTYMNPAAEKMTGYKLEEIKSRPLHESIHYIRPDGTPYPMSECPIDHSAEMLAPIREHEDVFVRKNGSFVYVSCSVAPLERAGKRIGAVLEVRDITERKHAEDEIRLLNDDLSRRAKELERAYKGLEDYSYSVSHDLRTPLRGIDIYAELLQEEHGEELSEEGRALLEKTRISVQKMYRLIDDLLAVSRLDRRVLTRTEVDMRGLAEGAWSDVELTNGGRKVQLHLHKMPPAWGDELLLRQVFINLFSNAVKFTRNTPDPTIEVGSMPSSEGSIYFVRDNGCGFDMKYSTKLFRVFQRLHPEEQYEGTGVGLVSVQRIIQKHGGRVWGEGHPGRGATFYFTLPGAAVRN